MTPFETLFRETFLFNLEIADLIHRCLLEPKSWPTGVRGKWHHLDR
jgi:hypothetical protein